MEMQLTGNGQRWSRRIAVDIPVQVAADGSPTIHGHLKDLSLSGALLTTEHALRLLLSRIYYAHRRFNYPP